MSGIIINSFLFSDSIYICHFQQFSGFGQIPLGFIQITQAYYTIFFFDRIIHTQNLSRRYIQIFRTILAFYATPIGNFNRVFRIIYPIITHNNFVDIHFSLWKCVGYFFILALIVIMVLHYWLINSR